MTRLTLLALTAAISLLTCPYVTAQREGRALSPDLERAIRELVRDELSKGRRAADPRARASRPRLVQPVPWPGRVLIPAQSPQALLRAAERAIEVDRSLSKKRRLAALQGLEAARKALGAEKAPATGRRTRLPGMRMEWITPQIQRVEVEERVPAPQAKARSKANPRRKRVY